jgi:hypothetical protein
MKKSDFVEITRKLWFVAIRPNMSSDFSVREKELIKELIRKCNEVKIYDDENDGEATRESRGQETNSTNLFSFQRDK